VFTEPAVSVQHELASRFAQGPPGQSTWHLRKAPTLSTAAAPPAAKHSQYILRHMLRLQLQPLRGCSCEAKEALGRDTGPAAAKAAAAAAAAAAGRGCAWGSA
jgi:hypothetical protein